jgi:predicted PurR-regulated permease PerM
MISHYLLSWVMQVGQFEGAGRETAEALGIGSGIFALALFSLSIYAWYKRRQPALAIVSAAFLLFFLRHLVQVLAEVYEFDSIVALPLVFADFVILALFFLAIVVRPKRKQLIEDSTDA